MNSELDLSEFCCLNENCPDYGKKDKGNIRFKERYGKQNRYGEQAYLTGCTGCNNPASCVIG